MRRGLLGVIAGLALMGSLPASAQALKFTPCRDGGPFACSRLTVPLDRSGAVPGSVTLRVERLRTRAKRPRPPLVLFAGGPGQSATRAYASLGSALTRVLARRDLIVFDQRGTGYSGLLRCRVLERANILSARVAGARCAGEIGARRAFYTSRDSADDLEALRAALGVPKLSLYGVSYGTRTALTYARRYPARVDRMALSSVVAPNGTDALGLDTLSAVPRVLRALCSNEACARVTRDPVADLAELIRRAGAKPIVGSVYDTRGRRRTDQLTGRDVLNVLVSGDFEPQLRTEFPGAVRSALRGDAAPMLRLIRRSIDVESVQDNPRDLSAAVYAATTCEEAALPWARTAPFGQRAADALQAVDSLPLTRFAPFDRLTAISDTVDLCRDWPAAPASPDAGLGPVPSIPTLVIEGRDDLRTPLESGKALAATNPRAIVVAVSGVGHDPEGQQLSRCAEQLTPDFFAGRRPPRACRDYRANGASVALPASLSDVSPFRGLRGREGRSLAAVRLALMDVADDVTYSADTGAAIARGSGLRGGTYRYDSDSGRLVLRGVSLVSGLRVTGRMSAFTTEQQRGRLRLSGPPGTRGSIAVRGQSYRGKVGGRRVSGSLNLAVAAVADASAASASASPERPGRRLIR